MNNPNIPGDKNQFISDNMGLVHHVCKKYTYILQYYSPILSYEDLVSIGSVGLVNAYNNFDPTKVEGIKFSTYAVAAIEGEVLRAYRDTSIGIKFSKDYKLAYLKINRANMLEEEPQKIAKKLGMSRKEVERGLLYNKMHIPAYLDTPVPDTKEGEITYGEALPQEVDYISQLIIQDFLSTLTDMQRTIYELDRRGYTQVTIAKTVGVTQPQIGRHLKKILQKAALYGEENHTQTTNTENITSIDKLSKKRSKKPVTQITSEHPEGKNSNINLLENLIALDSIQSAELEG